MTHPSPGQHPIFGLLSRAEAFAENDATSTSLPGLVTFVGFVDGRITAPWGSHPDWLLMYLDAQLQDWLLVEASGIENSGKIVNDVAPAGERDVIWVRRNAAVGRGSGTQSDEARFLTGEFTQAGDFAAAPGGGTMAASTGEFCGGGTALCCRRPSQG